MNLRFHGRRQVKKTALILILTLGCVIGVSADASQTLDLCGTVQPVVNLIVIPRATHLDVPLASTKSDLRIATVTETSNHPYSVTLDSANGWAMVGEQAGSIHRLPYTLKFGTRSSASFVPMISGTVMSPEDATTGTHPVSKGLYISFSPGSALKANTYSDTLIITITAP